MSIAAAGVPFSGVFYAHPLRITTGRFVSDLELICLVEGPGYVEGRVEWLPLRT